MQEKRNNRQLNKTQSGRHVDIFLTFAVMIVMLAVIIGSAVLPDRDKSENENRFLTQAPSFSIEDILSGEYQEKLEEYLSDQIIGRDNWVKIRSSVLKSIGYNDINGVYILDDGRLIERKTQADFRASRFKSNLDQVVELNNEVSEAGTQVRVMLVPTAAYSYRNEANLSTNYDEGEALSLAADILGEMYVKLDEEFMPDGEHKDGYYYMTDHHWNYDGAMKGASIYRSALELEEKEYTAEELTDDFKGTLYSKVLLSELIRDSICVPGESLDTDVTVTIDGETYDSIYFMDRLENKDKYEVFFGGNYDRVDIRNNGTETKRKPKLLIVKDSYANSFVPFILDDFSEITMVDPRYFRGSVKDLALDGEYDQVLILFNVTDFSEEKMTLNMSLLS
jgi:hypothetical protein